VDAVYDATVDASTGDVLREANMVKSEAPALVWERFPGNLVGGSAATVDLEAPGWLAPSATTLSGPNVHAFSDLDDNDAAAPSEEVTRTGGGFSFPFVSVAGSSCDDGHLCSWSGTASDRTGNRAQDTVQAFYFANRFHDHLAAIGFNEAAGAFQGADALQLDTLDGASGGPDSDHVNNANMFTPPDGTPPRMQMYLWRSPSRNVSSGSDAAILYHEYAHGLSNRLVTDADGAGALNSAEAGAMGEAWSDWYAQDFIVGQFPGLDTGAAGEVVMGEYTDFGASHLRTEPLDCPVGADPVRCPGRPALGSGGYTYGDFGRISGGAEVHADGEIWAQTLWDLRTALGTAKARALVTTGMALLPPEPSFLDGRNGILLADQTLYSGSDTGALWSLFAARGMGFFAAAVGGEDTAPAESFALPPAADGAKGTITGRVTNALGGGPVAGVSVGLAGLSTYAATTDADGRYTIAAVPEGTYLKVLAGGGGYDSEVSSLSVTGGVSITYSPVLRRNWASVRGGATIAASNGREYMQYGCGPNAAVDQSLGTGWSTDSDGEKYLIVQLPAAIDVTQFAFDPAESCGDTAVSATAGYRVETSPDGSAWTVARTGTFTSAARHTLNFVAPTAGSSGVRYARLTLLSSQGGAGAPYRDLAEFGVYGTSGQTTPTEPETTLEAGGPPFVFSSSEPGTFGCRIDDAAFAACTSPFVVGSLADGVHTFSVRAIDLAGNTDETPSTRTFTVDTAAPTATILTGPAVSSNDKTPEFTFESEPGAKFRCKLDTQETEGTYAACESPRVYDPLPDDSYTFSVRATDTVGNEGAPATRTFTIFTTGPQTRIVNGPEGLTRDRAPVFELRSTAQFPTFECKLDADEWASCTSSYPARELQDGPHTFQTRSTDTETGNVGTVDTRNFIVDGTPPETEVDSGPTEPVHSGPLAFAVWASDGTIECALDGGAYGSCATVLRADDLAAGEHIYRARATDAAGNVSMPFPFPFTVVNAPPAARLDVDADSGLAPHTLHATITATDADNDRLTYALDFGDGQTATGTLPAGAIEHRYTAAGAYTAHLRVTDGRDPVVAERAVTVTSARAQPEPAPTTPLSLTLSAPAVDLGTFIPGLARDYGGTLTATTTGPAATLRVADPSRAARGHLVSDTAALAEPLQVRATSGAFAPLDSTVTIPTTIEFKQSIGATETLRPGTYGKTLTFTLSTTTP
jgi:hypothetical protein